MIKAIYSKPITVLMLTITVFIFGIISLTRLPVTLMPGESADILGIITRYHGVSPEQIERVVTMPIEDAIGGIEGIKEIYSVTKEGESRIIVRFFPGQDIDHGAIKVREMVDNVASKFPRACEKPYILKNNPDDDAVFIFNMKCDEMSMNELRFYAENTVKKELSRIDGISEIDFAGGSIKEIHIAVDPAALIAYGLQITDISALVQQAYFVNSQGKIKVYSKDMSLYSDARFTSLQEIRLLPIHYDKEGNRPVLLKDVAEVYEGGREQESITRLNGEERVAVYIKKSGNANTLTVCDAIKDYIAGKNTQISYEIIYNQSDYIKTSINNVKNAAIIGGIIAILVLFIFIRNIKSITLISFSIPFSIILTFFFMYIFKVEINIMTLSGFAIGIGMLLDNGIVMIESLAYDLKYHTWKMSEQSVSPIISSTLTTIAIFFPITFLNYDFRRLYGGLALTVTFSLISSVLCSLVIVPAGFSIFNRFIKHEKHHTETSLFIEHYTMVVLKFFWRKSYIVLGIVVILLIATPVFILRMDQEYLDPARGNEITAYVEMEAGTSLPETNRIVKKVEGIFKSDDAVLRVNSRVQKWHADIDIKYDSKKHSSQEKFIQYIKTKTDSLKECFVHYEEKNANEGRIIDIDIIGDNDRELREIAKISAKTLSQVRGVRSVVLKFKEGKPSLTWRIDRDKCQDLSVPINSAGEQLRWAIYGPVALKYIKDNKEMDLRVSYSEQYKKSLRDIKEMLINNEKREKIYIKELGSFIEDREPGKIYRKNKRKTVRIGVNLGDLSLGKAIPKIKRALKEVELKDGYYFDFGSTLEKFKESRRVVVFALLLSIFMIYAILAIQFESFIIPLKVIPIIPISASFSILVLFLLHMSLNLAVYIGLIILSGVVVNNTILITEASNNTGKPSVFSLYKVIKTRIKPVFITTLTTTLALIPMIIQTGEGAELWRPLAITLISGLIFGTFINLALFPLFLLKNKKFFK